MDSPQNLDAVSAMAMLGHALVRLEKIIRHLGRQSNRLMVNTKNAGEMLDMNVEEVTQLCNENKLRYRNKGVSNRKVIEYQSLVEYCLEVFSDEFMCDNHFTNRQGARLKGANVTAADCNKFGINPKNKR